MLLPVLLPTATQQLLKEGGKRLCGDVHRFYRLHAAQPHSIDMALAYNIKCPKCHTHLLKQVGRCLNYHDLGLYKCPVCDKD